MIFAPKDSDHRFCKLEHARENEAKRRRNGDPSLSKKRQELLEAVQKDFDRIFKSVKRGEE